MTHYHKAVEWLTGLSPHKHEQEEPQDSHSDHYQFSYLDDVISPPWLVA